MTKHLLLPEFDRVDLLEQSPRLIGAAGDFIGEEASRLRFLCLGMQVREKDMSLMLVLVIEKRERRFLPQP